MAIQTVEPLVKNVKYEGRFLRFVEAGGWEYVERTKVSGIVVILAVTPENKMIFVEQYRPPIASLCLEIPAGLAGDIVGQELEALEIAASRELLEETGYQADTMTYLTHGASSAGLCTEIVTFFRAEGLKKVTLGGGDASEQINVIEVPLNEVADWLQKRISGGAYVDFKVYTALFFALQKA
ncbi:DNA mismatch repair protein MutT [Verrucomicrobia bacterium LW23]|nr:DNA mismatch repair protein MutT [Verrucomicrobia bacterium LW23]